MDDKESWISRSEKIVSTIVHNSNFTNERLAWTCNVSISTIKRWKLKIKKANGKVVVSHNNTNNQNAKKYSDEDIRKIGEIYEENAKITGGSNNNESCSYLTLFLFFITT